MVSRCSQATQSTMPRTQRRGGEERRGEGRGGEDPGKEYAAGGGGR